MLYSTIVTILGEVAFMNLEALNNNTAKLIFWLHKASAPSVLKQTNLLVVNHNHLRNDLFLLCFHSNQHLLGASIKVILVIFDFKSQVRGRHF